MMFKQTSCQIIKNYKHNQSYTEDVTSERLCFEKLRARIILHSNWKNVKGLLEISLQDEEQE